MSDLGFSGPVQATTDKNPWNDVAARARYYADAFPQMAADPTTLAAMSLAPINPTLGAAQAYGLGAANDAKTQIDRVKGWQPSAQRTWWYSLDQAQQQVYAALGYAPPSGETKRSIVGTELAKLSTPVAGVWEGLYRPSKTVLGGGLNALQQVAEVPLEMYGNIRSGSEAEQIAAGIMGVVAIGAVMAFSGGSAAALLPGLAAAGGLGATVTGGAGITAYTLAGIGGAFAGKAIYDTLTGNPSNWMNAVNLKGNTMERNFLPGAQAKAARLVGDNGAVLNFAKDIAYGADTAELLTEFAGQRDATADPSSLVLQATVEKLARRAGLNGTAEYQQAYDAGLTMLQDPRFLEAIDVLRNAKISPGRDIARLIHLDNDTGLGKLISGSTDALAWFITDPIMGATKVLHFSRIGTYGLEALMDGTLASQIANKVDNPRVQRAFEVMSNYLNANDYSGMARFKKEWAGLYTAMKNFEGERIAKDNLTHFHWDADQIVKFLETGDAWKALATGKTSAWKTGFIEIPHLTGFQSWALRQKTELYNLVEHLDDIGVERALTKADIGGEIESAARIGEHAEAVFNPNGGIGKYRPQQSWVWHSANMVVDNLEGIPYLRRIPTGPAGLAKSMLTRVPLHNYIDLGSKYLGQRANEEIQAFVELGRQMGIPSEVRAHWVNLIVGQGEHAIAAKRAAVMSYYDMMFEAAGLNKLAEGRRLTDEFLRHADQAYVLGRDHATLLSETSEAIAIPNIRELRKAGMHQTLLRNVLNVADSDLVAAKLNRFWKPAVLLRMGFVTRAVGDELLAWLAREGLSGITASIFARSIVDEDRLVGHVRWIEEMYNAMVRTPEIPAAYVANGWRGMFDLPLADHAIEIKALHDYSRGLKAIGRNGLLAEIGIKEGGAVGRWLKADRTFRGLIFGGVPDSIQKSAQIWAASPELRAAAAREFSAGKTLPIRDPLEAGKQVPHVTYKGDRWSDLSALDQVRLRSSFTFLKSEETALRWHAAQQIRQTVMGEIVDHWLKAGVIDLVDSRVAEQLTRLGVQDTPGWLSRLHELSAGMSADQRKVLVYLLEFHRDPTEAGRVLVDSIADKDLRKMVGRTIRRLRPGSKATQAEALATELVANGHPMYERLGAAMDHTKAFMGTAEAQAGGYLQGVVSLAHPERVPRFRIEWTEADLKRIHDEATHAWLATPAGQAAWPNMEDSVRTAITNRQVVRQGIGEARHFFPLVDNEALINIPNITVGSIDALPVQDQVKVMLKHLIIGQDMGKVDRAGRGIVDGLGYLTMTELTTADARIAQEVSQAFYMLSGRTPPPTAPLVGEISLPKAALGGRSEAGGVGEIRREGGYQWWRVDPSQSANTFIPDAGGNMIEHTMPDGTKRWMPGASEAEARQEWIDKRYEAFRSQLFARPAPVDPQADDAIKSIVTEVLTPGTPPRDYDLNGQQAKVFSAPELGGPLDVSVGADGEIVVAISAPQAEQDLANGLGYLRGEGHYNSVGPLAVDNRPPLTETVDVSNEVHLNADPTLVPGEVPANITYTHEQRSNAVDEAHNLSSKATKQQRQYADQHVARMRAAFEADAEIVLRPGAKPTFNGKDFVWHDGKTGGQWLTAEGERPTVVHVESFDPNTDEGAIVAEQVRDFLNLDIPVIIVDTDPHTTLTAKGWIQSLGHGVRVDTTPELLPFYGHNTLGLGVTHSFDLADVPIVEMDLGGGVMGEASLGHDRLSPVIKIDPDAIDEWYQDLMEAFHTSVSQQHPTFNALTTGTVANADERFNAWFRNSFGYGEDFDYRTFVSFMNTQGVWSERLGRQVYGYDALYEKTLAHEQGHLANRHNHFINTTWSGNRGGVYPNIYDPDFETWMSYEEQANRHMVRKLNLPFGENRKYYSGAFPDTLSLQFSDAKDAIGLNLETFHTWLMGTQDPAVTYQGILLETVLRRKAGQAMDQALFDSLNSHGYSSAAQMSMGPGEGLLAQGRTVEAAQPMGAQALIPGQPGMTGGAVQGPEGIQPLLHDVLSVDESKVLRRWPERQRNMPEVKGIKPPPGMVNEATDRVGRLNPDFVTPENLDKVEAHLQDLLENGNWPDDIRDLDQEFLGSPGEKQLKETLDAVRSLRQKIDSGEVPEPFQGAPGMRGASRPPATPEAEASAAEIGAALEAEHVVPLGHGPKAAAGMVDAVNDVARHFEDGHVVVRFGSRTVGGPSSVQGPVKHLDDLESLLEHGSIVPGTPLGDAGMGYRAKAETSHLGADQPLVYGYLSRHEDAGVVQRSAAGYGDIRLILKDDVRDRSTMTLGDSLRPNSGHPDLRQDHLAAVPLGHQFTQTDELMKSVSSLTLRDIAAAYDPATGTYDLAKLNSKFEWRPSEGYASLNEGDYIETQIHGGVSLDDIEAVDTSELRDTINHNLRGQEKVDALERLDRVEQELVARGIKVGRPEGMKGPGTLVEGTQGDAGRMVTSPTRIEQGLPPVEVTAAANGGVTVNIDGQSHTFSRADVKARKIQYAEEQAAPVPTDVTGGAAPSGGAAPTPPGAPGEPVATEPPPRGARKTAPSAPKPTAASLALKPRPVDTTGQGSRMFWEAVGPVVAEKQLAAKGLTDVNKLEFADQAELPHYSQVKKPVYVNPAEQATWDKVVRFGFGQVIGPMIDKMIRTPMAFSSFSKARADLVATQRWLYDPYYFGHMNDHRLENTILEAHWQGQPYRKLHDALTNMDDMTDPLVRRAAEISGGMPWFDAPGKPTVWLTHNREKVARTLVEARQAGTATKADELLLDEVMSFTVRPKITHEDWEVDPQQGRSTPGLLRRMMGKREQTGGKTWTGWSYTERQKATQAFRVLDMVGPNEDGFRTFEKALQQPEPVQQAIRQQLRDNAAAHAARIAQPNTSDVIKAGVQAWHDTEAENLNTLYRMLEGGKSAGNVDDRIDLLMSWWSDIESSHPGEVAKLLSKDEAISKEAAEAITRTSPLGHFTREQQLAIKGGWNNVQAVESHINDLAMERAISETLPFIDRDNVKTQFSESVRNLIPFWHAEDQFMRRWARVAYHSPEFVRKAQLLYLGMKDVGMVQTDQYGNDMFVYPGSTVLAEVVGKLPFFKTFAPLATAMTGQVKYSLPGLDRFGVPQVSPFVAIPMTAVAQVVPEIAPYNAALLGDRGSRMSIARAIVPTQFARFWDAFMANPDSNTQMATSMMQAIAVLEANGYGLPDNATTEQEQVYMDRLRQHTRTIALTKAIFGFFAPAAPQPRIVGGDQKGSMGSAWSFQSLTGLKSPGAALNREYIDLVRNLGVEKGTTRFLELYPDSTPDDLLNRNIAYRVSSTESVSGAPISATQEGWQFYKDNETFMKQAPMAGPWLMPAPTSADMTKDRSASIYMDAMSAGLRQRKAPEDFMRAIKFAVGSIDYFQATDMIDEQLDVTTDQTKRNQIQAFKTIWTQSYLAANPIFAEELQSGDGRARRKQVLDSLRAASQDPNRPQGAHADAIMEMLGAYDIWKAEMTKLQDDNTKVGIQRRKQLKALFRTWGEMTVEAHPDMMSFWNGVLLPRSEGVMANQPDQNKIKEISKRLAELQAQWAQIPADDRFAWDLETASKNTEKYHPSHWGWKALKDIGETAAVDFSTLAGGSGTRSRDQARAELEQVTSVGGRKASEIIDEYNKLKKEADENHIDTSDPQAMAAAAADPNTITVPVDKNNPSGTLDTFKNLFAQFMGQGAAPGLTDDDIRQSVGRSAGVDFNIQNNAVALGTNPLDYNDKEGIYWNQVPRSDIKAVSRDGGGYITQDRHARYLGKNDWVETYSWKQALQKPYDMSDQELQNLSQKLWAAGFLNLQGYDYTKSFDDQYAADAHDQGFMTAYKNWLQESYTDRTKSAFEILNDRVQRRLPIIEKARRDEVDKKVKAATGSLRFADPAGIASLANQVAGQELGRGATQAERQMAVSNIRTAEVGNAQASIDGRPVVNLDEQARVTNAIRDANPAEAEAVDQAKEFDLFRQLLGGMNGGR